MEEDLEQENLQIDEGALEVRTTTPLKVTREDIEEVIAKWTGIPMSSIHEEEMSKLIRMEEELHKRIISQDRAITRTQQGDPPLPRRAEIAKASGRFFPVPRPHRRRQNRDGQVARGVPFRQRKRHDPA